MKKFLTLGFAALSILAAQADDFTVYSNGSPNGSLDYYNWYNTKIDYKATNPDGDGVVLSLTKENPAGADFSGGLNARPLNDYIGKLATSNLTFEYYPTETGSIEIRLTCGGEQNYILNVTDAELNKWNAVSISVADSYQNIAPNWIAYKNDGEGYVFGFHVVNMSGNATVYFKDIIYKDINTSWTKPNVEAEMPPTANVPTLPAEDVVSLISGKYPTAAPNFYFTNGAWGESTRSKLMTDENGAPVYKLTSFTYIGMENINPRVNVDGFDYMHVEFYPTTETKFGFTPISPGKEAPYIAETVIQNQWNVYDVPLSHWSTVDFTDIFQVKIDQGTGGEGYIANIYFWKDNRVIPALSASISDVTSESAVLSYEVTLPEQLQGYTVKVYLDDVEITENPYTITGLEEATEYIKVVKATATSSTGETIDSDPVTLKFTTLRAGARDYIYSDIYKAEFKNAYLTGEDPSMARSFYVSMPWEVIYAADGTAKYTVDLSDVANFNGLVPQIYWDGFKHLTRQDESDIWEYDFGQQTLEGPCQISHYIAYTGAALDVRTPYTQWGMENEAPVLGEATGMTLSASKNKVKLDEPVILTVVPTDAQGYYLPAGDVDYTVVGGSYTLENGILKLTQDKGERTITATMGTISASTVIDAWLSKESEDLIAGKAGYTDTENIMENTVVENATDGNINTELRWSCATTDEHYLIYDLGGSYKVEGIDLLFEGAYATEFTITLSYNAPAEIQAATQASRRADYASTDDVVFTPAANNTQHYFTNTDNTAHQYVALRTTKALNSGWGIKVKEIKLYAVPSGEVTGIEALETENNAPARYFNLQGVEVSRPENGVYIEVRGNQARKIKL